MSVLEAVHVKYVYSVGTPFEHVALDDISFRVTQGEFVGVIGHTGSGKSTLMQQFNGLLKPSEGKILLDGKDIHEKGFDLKGLRSRVGLVFQYPEYQLFEETVRRDIAFGPKNMGLAEQEIEERVVEAARFVELTDEMLDKSPFELSGGERRRAAIAGVLAMRPDILVLDEPTAGLDPRTKLHLLDEIGAYHEKTNATILFVTHSMEDIARMADRLIVLNESRIYMDDKPETVFADPEKLAKIGLDVPQVTRVFMELKKLGVDVETSVYTVRYAAKLISHMLEEGNKC